MNTESLSEHESLAIISNMINRAKNQFSENGHLYLLWGWVILICSAGHFALLHYSNVSRPYLIWLLTWLAVIYQMIYLYRHRKKQRVKTYTDEIIGHVWLVFVILMFLFAFLFGRMLSDSYYYYINPGFLALYGMPTFLSGVILKFKPLQIGGICCWVLSGIATGISYDYQLLLLATAVVAAWIIPGYILRSRYKHYNS